MITRRNVDIILYVYSMGNIIMNEPSFTLNGYYSIVHVFFSFFFEKLSLFTSSA